jgi:hypothetical protein
MVGDRQFERMRNTANDLNFEVAQLEPADAYEIRNSVRDRIRWRRKTAEPPDPYRDLMNRVLNLLEHPNLSPKQAAQLERVFFRIES